MRRILCASLTFLFAIHTPYVTSGSMPYASPYGGGMGAPGANFGMNESDMVNMLEELENEIAKLSPEEKKNFDEMVSAFGESLMTMSDDEFDRFITGNMPENEIMDRFGHIGPPRKEDTQAEEMIEETKHTEPVVEVKQPSKESVQASKMIESIISHTESLVRKMPPDISFRLSAWTGNRELVHWKPTLEWITFEKDLETFRAKLAQIRDDRDVKRKEIYIEALLANKQLYNNLDQLRATLDEHDGQLGERSLVLKASSDLMPQEAKSLRIMLDKYAEAIYVLKVSEEIDAVLKAYEQNEKELLAAEKSAQKKAEQYRGPQRGRTDIAGVAGESSYGSPAYGDLDSIGRGFRDPYSAGYDYDRAPYRPETDTMQPEAPRDEPKGPLSNIPKSNGKRGADSNKPKKHGDTTTKTGQDAKTKEDTAAKKTMTTAEQTKSAGQAYGNLQQAANKVTAARQLLGVDNSGLVDYIAAADADSQADQDAIARINEACQELIKATQEIGKLDQQTKQNLRSKIERDGAARVLQPLRKTLGETMELLKMQPRPATARYRLYITGSASVLTAKLEESKKIPTGDRAAFNRVTNEFEDLFAANQGLSQVSQEIHNTFERIRQQFRSDNEAELKKASQELETTLPPIKYKLPDLAALLANLDQLLPPPLFAVAAAQGAQQGAPEPQQAGPPPVPAEVDEQPAEDVQGGAVGEPPIFPNYQGRRSTRAPACPIP